MCYQTMKSQKTHKNINDDKSFQNGDGSNLSAKGDVAEQQQQQQQTSL
jgi:hypothetical protein